jgi:hypothetical protein
MEATRHAGAGASSIDEYIAAFPADVQAKLQSVRRAIHEAAPGAEEAIKACPPSYSMATSSTSVDSRTTSASTTGPPRSSKPSRTNLHRTNSQRAQCGSRLTSRCPSISSVGWSRPERKRTQRRPNPNENARRAWRRFA